MKTYKEIRDEYVRIHLSKSLKTPQRRINALAAIERTIKGIDPSLLEKNKLYLKYNKENFSEQYLKWKRKPLSSAEKSVILGLFTLD
ncbi:MAG: hypothetical protein HC830_01125 [Bacteroidetes bacterium]|nr:hypothetical protein [Bacteroidota bacterium]